MDPLTLAYAGLFLGLALPRRYFTRASRRGTPAPDRALRDDAPRLRRMKALGLLGLLGTALFLAAPALLQPLSMPFPTALRWSGVALGTSAIALFAWTHQSLGAEWSVRLRVREGGVLITRGPYRWVRHPMYTSAVLWATALALASANLAAGVPWLALALLAAARAPDEEAVLAEAHGAEYHAYAARTGRFLPRLARTGAPQG